MRFGLALLLGLLTALVLTGLPASAADQAIVAVAGPAWQPPTATINVGDKVTWTNPGAGFHNVCVRRSGSSGCSEFEMPAAPTTSWPADVSHTFSSDGTFEFICEFHTSMKGTVTVGTGVNPQPTQTTGTGTGTGTGTSTTPDPGTQPTDTTTAPTQTEATPLAADDTTAPAFTGQLKRRSSRKALILDLGSSEDGTLKATVFRRPPRGRAFSKVGEASLHVKQGRNVVTLPRKARGSLRSGSYKVKLQLVDEAGNKSATKTLSFKLA